MTTDPLPTLSLDQLLMRATATEALVTAWQRMVDWHGPWTFQHSQVLKAINEALAARGTHQVRETLEGTINPRWRCTCGWMITTHFNRAEAIIAGHLAENDAAK